MKILFFVLASFVFVASLAIAVERRDHIMGALSMTIIAASCVIIGMELKK